MKMNCIIVDDEPLSRIFLKRYCEKSEKAVVKESFENATDAISYLNGNNVDIIFLDVEMPGINGFQMLDHLEKIPKVIMTTSKTDYAFTAFEYNVTDFLKKPVMYNRFLEALTKVEESFAGNSPETKNDIIIKSNGSYVKLPYKDILYIEGMGDYVKYVTPEKTYITHSTMKAAEEMVSKGGFIKVHRSYIVNAEKIKNFTGNTLSLNNISIPVSKSNKAELLQRLKTA